MMGGGSDGSISTALPSRRSQPSLPLPTANVACASALQPMQGKPLPYFPERLKAASRCAPCRRRLIAGLWLLVQPALPPSSQYREIELLPCALGRSSVDARIADVRRPPRAPLRRARSREEGFDAVSFSDCAAECSHWQCCTNGSRGSGSICWRPGIFLNNGSW